MQTMPARTPRASRVWKVVATTLQASIAVTSPMTSRMAGTGEWKRSETFARRSGSRRSKDHAKTVRTGMNVFPTIAGSDQNRNEPTMIVVRMLLLTARPAKKWKNGPVGSTYAEFGAVLAPTMNWYPATL